MYHFSINATQSLFSAEGEKFYLFIEGHGTVKSVSKSWKTKERINKYYQGNQFISFFDKKQSVNLMICEQSFPFNFMSTVL